MFSSNSRGPEKSESLWSIQVTHRRSETKAKSKRTTFVANSAHLTSGVQFGTQSPMLTEYNPLNYKRTEQQQQKKAVIGGTYYEKETFTVGTERYPYDL